MRVCQNGDQKGHLVISENVNVSFQETMQNLATVHYNYVSMQHG